jgi:glutamine amidotransferase
MRPLRDALSEESYTNLLGTTDSETVFALFLDHLRTTKTAPSDADALAAATAETVRRVSGVCARLGVLATLNVVVTDGRAMAFVRLSTEGPGNSLYLLSKTGVPFPGRSWSPPSAWTTIPAGARSPTEACSPWT